MATRLPNTHDADAPARLWAQLQLPAAARAASPGAAENLNVTYRVPSEGSWGLGWAGAALTAAPFPFLPLPPLRCPHRASCEGASPPLRARLAAVDARARSAGLLATSGED